MYSCELCGKSIKNQPGLLKHQSWCREKQAFLEHYDLDKDKIQKEYNLLGSIQEFKRKYPFFKNERYYNLFKDFNIDYSLKKSACSENTKNKKKETHLKKYGIEHNFCKNSESRKKWEKELLDKEGITNVFQRDSVKIKCINSIIEKYGSKNNAGRKLQKGTSISKLNKILYNILNESQIVYNAEFAIKYSKNKIYYYDVQIDSKIIEINGDYWHGNPILYKADDIILKGSSKEILVKDKWEKDRNKIEVAKNNNFQVLVIWEYDLKNNFEETKNRILEYVTCKD